MSMVFILIENIIIRDKQKQIMFIFKLSKSINYVNDVFNNLI